MLVTIAQLSYHSTNISTLCTKMLVSLHRVLIMYNHMYLTHNENIINCNLVTLEICYTPKQVLSKYYNSIILKSNEISPLSDT